MNGPLEWIAAIGTMIAAGLIASDRGRRVTGWGFLLFCGVSLAWIVAGITSDALPIAAMNAILLLINAWGAWRYLLNPKNARIVDRMEQIAPAIEAEVEQDMAREG
jgi:hypothetical protein